jgi:hypothetical protein
MAFVDSFVSKLNEQGIPADASMVLEDPTTLEAVLDRVEAWWSELNPDVRDGFDEGSEEFAVCHVLAEPDVNVAPELAGLLQAFDQVADRRLSDLLQTTRDALAASLDNA